MGPGSFVADVSIALCNSPTWTHPFCPHDKHFSAGTGGVAFEYINVHTPQLELAGFTPMRELPPGTQLNKTWKVVKHICNEISGKSRQSASSSKSSWKYCETNTIGNAKEWITGTKYIFGNVIGQEIKVIVSY